MSSLKLVIIVLVFFITIPAHAAAPETSARAYLVMDEASGAVRASKNPDVPHPVASLTKLMSAVIFLEQNPRFERRIKMLREDEVGGGRLRFPVGSILTVRDLLYASLVGSANNSANALARVSGLPRKLFIHEMNVRAAVLGLARTEFFDVSGMNPRNTTTARDMALLARYAFSNPTIAGIAGTKTYDIRPVGSRQQRTLTNTNALLGMAVGSVTITAGKTGYLEEAEYNLVVRAEDPAGRRVIIVVLGAPTKAASFANARSLAESAF